MSNLLDWANLPFGYMRTDYNVRCIWKDGAWGKLEVTSSEYLMMHMAATCLHYGQEAFEGLKAFRGRDGKIRIFRIRANARRMKTSGEYIKMKAPDEELFVEAIRLAVKLNERFVPPCESGASLYIRPLLIGTGAQVGVSPAQEYTFLVFVTPVGPYFKSGFKPVDVIITRDTDRAAPLGTGHIKVGGNYAASLPALDVAHHQGYATCLYLDAREKKYIDECGPANFFGIKGNSYVTPDSHSVLPSITNDSLMTLAADMGMKVERRHIPVEELADFSEAGQCGTAAVISPLGKVFDPGTNKVYEFPDSRKAGNVCEVLYNKLRAIQFGDAPDTYGWVDIID
jgi:branched-chain amino acid aminotransferase